MLCRWFTTVNVYCKCLCIINEGDTLNIYTYSIYIYTQGLHFFTLFLQTSSRNIATNDPSSRAEAQATATIRTMLDVKKGVWSDGSTSVVRGVESGTVDCGVGIRVLVSVSAVADNHYIHTYIRTYIRTYIHTYIMLYV